MLNSIRHSPTDASCEIRYVSAISAKAALIHHFLGLYYEHDDLYWSTAVVMFRMYAVKSMYIMQVVCYYYYFFVKLSSIHNRVQCMEYCIP